MNDPNPEKRSPSDDGSASDEALQRVLRQREHHRQRSVPVRVAVALGGFVVGIFGAVLALPAPEVGLPLLLVGLRLLAYEFDWAARLYARVARFAGRVRGWWRGLSPWTRRVLGAALVLVVVLIVVALSGP